MQIINKKRIKRHESNIISYKVHLVGISGKSNRDYSRETIFKEAVTKKTPK